MRATDPQIPFAENPVLVRVRRGGRVESQHRGAWVLVDPSGEVREGAGDFEAAIFARSAVKSLQALPLIESGAAKRHSMGEPELAMALASHNAEARQTEIVRGMLERARLGVEHLQCGAQVPGDPEARAALRAAGEKHSDLHNNCSGKHAGFLALARHLDVEPAEYLAPDSASQVLVRHAVLEMTGVSEEQFEQAIDGCSAPTFRLPLRGLATGFARVANPDGLAPVRAAACRQMQRAVATHPDLIAGRHKRLCTAIARASGGRLFPKIGAEGVYGLGCVDGGLALAVKIDDGGQRALHALVLALIARFEWLDEAALASLSSFSGTPLRNWAGIEVGETEVLI